MGEDWEDVQWYTHLMCEHWLKLEGAFVEGKGLSGQYGKKWGPLLCKRNLVQERQMLKYPFKKKKFLERRNLHLTWAMVLRSARGDQSSFGFLFGKEAVPMKAKLRWKEATWHYTCLIALLWLKIKLKLPPFPLLWPLTILHIPCNLQGQNELDISYFTPKSRDTGSWATG